MEVLRPHRPLALLAALGLFASLGAGAAGARAEGYTSDVSTIQVVSTKVGEKNVFIPSTIVVVAGKEQKLSLFNSTDTPHGFAIDGLGIEVVLPVGTEYELTLPALEGGHVYGIRCHLHPPHRTATLVVLPGE